MRTKGIQWKKSVMLMLVLTLMMVLAACGGANEDTQQGSEDNTSAEEENQGSNDGEGSENSNEGSSFEVSISNFMPDGHVLNQKIMMPLADQLTEKTDGRIDASVYPGGALGSPGQHYDLAQNGVADIAITIHGYTPGRFPATQVGELPFIVPYEASNAENITKVLWNIKEDYPMIEEEHKGTKILALFTADPAVFIVKDQEIESLDDLQGLKIRTPSASAKGIIEALGATPVSMPMPDVYDAMQKGVIDGAFGVMTALKQFKLAEVSDYVVNSKIYGTTFALVMNRSSYDQFQGEDLELLKSLTGKEMSLKAARAFDSEVEESIEMAENNGVTVRDLTQQEIDTVEQKVQPVIEEWIASMKEKDIPGEQMYEEAIQMGGNLSKE